MFVKSLLAGAMALALSSPQQVPASTTFVASPWIEKISCDEGSGTGFKLASGEWITVWHVARMAGCSVDGIPITVSHHDERGDFAIIDVPGDNRPGGYGVDCSGFQPRKWYHAQGHALGLPVVRSIAILYPRLLDELGANRGWSVLIYNQVVPGQSGGPVVGEDGRVVGTVNALHPYALISYSRALKETPICQSA